MAPKFMKFSDRKHENALKRNRRDLFFLIVFLFFEYVRLQDSYLSFLGPFKIPTLLNLYLLGLVYVYWDKLPKDRNIYLVLSFVGLMAVHVPFATNNFHAFNVTKLMLLTVIVLLATPIIINRSEALKKLFEAMVYIVFLVSVWVILHGGVGPGGIVSDENDVCLFLVIGLPFCWYFSQLSGVRSTKRWIALATACIATVAIITTSSRGGFLGLVAVLGMMLLFSQKPVRNIIFSLIYAGVLGGVAVNLLPPEYVADMATITDKQNSTRNLRFLHWTTAWEIFKDNPLIGVGPQNYPWTSGEYFHLSPFFEEGARGRSGRQSHSLYFTLIPEMGIVGVIIFLALTTSFYRRGLLIRKLFKNRKSNAEVVTHGSNAGLLELEVITKFYNSLLVAMSGFLVSATFVSVLYYPFYWNLVGFSLAAWWIFVGSDHLDNSKFRKPSVRSK